MMLSKACLDNFLSVVCNVFDAYSVVLFLPDPDEAGFFRIAGYFSLGDHVRSEARISPGQGIVGWIIRDNKPYLLNNLDRKGDCLGYYDQATESKIKAFMGCPLGKAKGVLCIDTKKTYSFDNKAQKLLQTFAGFIECLSGEINSIVSGKTRNSFYDFLINIQAFRRSNPRWPSFIKHFLEEMSRTTGFKYCLFASRDAYGKGYYIEDWNQKILLPGEKVDIKYNIAAGLIGYVFKNGMPIYSPDKEGGPSSLSLFGTEARHHPIRSVICLPLDVSRRTRGVLVLAHDELIEITEEYKDFGKAVSEHLALFLENLYLKDRMAQTKAKAP